MCSMVSAPPPNSPELGGLHELLIAGGGDGPTQPVIDLGRRAGQHNISMSAALGAITLFLPNGEDLTSSPQKWV
eukprot:1983980-Alexandrium_andersonii.AAC.1